MIAALTKEEEAYKDLRKLILHGTLPIGVFLSQRQLADQVKAAVVTVRGALRRLEGDGLVESQPKWGFRIVQETEEQLRDRYFMREILEVTAVERIVERRDPADEKRIRELAKYCDEASDCASGVNVTEFAERHSNLHLTMAKCSGSTILAETLERMNLRSLMLTNAARGWGRGRDRLPSYHQELVEAIFTYDKEKAVAAIRQHVRRGLEWELEAIHEKENSPEM